MKYFIPEARLRFILRYYYLVTLKVSRNGTYTTIRSTSDTHATHPIPETPTWASNLPVAIRFCMGDENAVRRF